MNLPNNAMYSVDKTQEMQQQVAAVSRNNQDGTNGPANVYESGQMPQNLLSNATAAIGNTQSNINKRSIIT